MAENLIPIAVSSEMDVSGNERIHAAARVRTVRPEYVAPEFSFYISNANFEGVGSFSSFDPSTFSQLNNTPLNGGSPRRITGLANGSKVYAADYGDGNAVEVLNTTTFSVSTISGFINPWAIKVSPDNTKVYVVNRVSLAPTISVINTATDTVINTYNGQQVNIESVAVNLDGSKLYCAGYADVTVVDSTDGSLLDTIIITGVDDTRDVVESVNGSTLYVAGLNGIAVIDTASMLMTSIIPAYHIYRLFVTNSRLYAVGPNGLGSEVLLVIDRSTHTILQTILLTGSPGPALGVSVNRNETLAYVCTYSSPTTVFVVNLNTYTIATTITMTGKYGFDMIRVL